MIPGWEIEWSMRCRVWVARNPQWLPIEAETYELACLLAAARNRIFM